MQVPLQITFRNMDASEAVAARIREKSKSLDRFYDSIESCRVTVEAPHRHHHKGGLYRVRIDLVVPGGTLTVDRSPAEHHAHEDVYVAVRDAFEAAVRRLEDYARRQRGDVKTSHGSAQGRISSLTGGDGYGFIELADGEAVYFHRNSVVGGRFEDLRVGEAVSVVTTEGEKGPQATTVHPLGGHRLAG